MYMYTKLPTFASLELFVDGARMQLGFAIYSVV